MSVRFVRENQLVTSGEDGMVKTWKLPEQSNPTHTHTNPLTSVASSNAIPIVTYAERGRVYVAGNNGTIRWSSAPESSICHLSISEDARLIAVTLEDNAIALVDSETGSLLNRLSDIPSASNTAFSPTHSQLATIEPTGELVIFDTENATKLAQIPLDPQHINRREYTCAYSRDGRFLVCGGDIGMILIVDVERQEIWKTCRGTWGDRGLGL